MILYEMFGFVKKIFISAMMFYGCNLSNVHSLKFISMNNQQCKVRPEVVNFNSDEPVFSSFSIKTSSCSFNSINDPYATFCVPDVVKNINIKVFNPISRTNETRHIKFHETCKSKCRIGANVCKNKQRWSEDKFKCECNELIDKRICDKIFIWNPSNSESECNKSCNVGEHLDYEMKKKNSW